MASVVVSLVFAFRSAARSRGSAPRDPLAPRSAGGPEPLAPLATSSDRGGSGSLGVAVARVERLADGARPRQVGHRYRLAPTRVPSVLDVKSRGVSRDQSFTSSPPPPLAPSPCSRHRGEPHHKPQQNWGAAVDLMARRRRRGVRGRKRWPSGRLSTLGKRVQRAQSCGISVRDPSSPAPAISLSPQPTGASQETSMKPGCGCGPDVKLTTLGSLATHCNQLLVVGSFEKPAA